jgi:hypothetical protein
MKTLAEVRSFLDADGRISGRVQLHHSDMRSWAAAGEPAAVANALAQRWGYSAISPGAWLLLTRDAAAEVACRLLSADLAYKFELLPPKTATYAAECLVDALSGGDARFLCNAEFRGTSISWEPIGQSTFETALVGFDGAQAFLLYADAED